MTRDEFMDIFDGCLPVMLEDKRMGWCAHVNDTHALVDVYSGHDHDGMLHIPFANFLMVPLIGLIAGLKGVDRRDDAEFQKHGIPAHVTAGSIFEQIHGRTSNEDTP